MFPLAVGRGIGTEHIGIHARRTSIRIASTVWLVLSCLVVSGAGFGCAKEMVAPAPKDVVDTAVAAGSFKTLAKALETAGLIDTLKGKGPFTVFGPTDKAFAALPPKE